jgi:membrane protein DedA with SNARE-associated domain
MGRISIICGSLLIVLGLGAFLLAVFAPVEPHASPTTLIPAGFGVVLVLLGVLARREKLRMHVMHAAATVGLIGFIMPAVMATMTAVKLAGGGDFGERSPESVHRALAVQTTMAVICAVFVVLCVRSFIVARRNRARAENPSA